MMILIAGYESSGQIPSVYRRTCLQDSLPALAAPARDQWDRFTSSQTYRMTYVAVPLIAAGLIVAGEDSHFHSLRDNFLPSFRHHYDDYLQYAMLGLKIGGIQGRSSWGRMLVSDAFSASLMAIAVNTLKHTVKVMRPDGSNRHSFPSGHSATAFMTATMLLNSGEADAVLAVGGESILCPIVVSGLAQAKALSRRNDDPEHACRPFDADRDGFVIGEGGGALLIETEEHAVKRGATIYARLAGWANTSDAHHVTAPCPDGEGAARCMKLALARAGMQPSDIGYINAHGTSTPLGDKAETLAVKSVFGGRECAPPMSSTKSATGHLMGAGGLTEVIACIMAVREGVLPPTLHLDTPDPDCDLDYVPNTARKADISAAMSNSLGFGGQNSSIIVAKYEL